MGVYKATKTKGLEPHKWPIVKVADVGADEPFVQAILDLLPIVDAGTIWEPERQEVKEAITSILMDGLMPAFLELQRIRASLGQDMPLMNRLQPYEDFSRKLWKSYKDLMEKAARLMGFKIGFLFDNEKKFGEGLKKFRKENPRIRVGFEKFLEQTREEWQNELAKFRNTWLEHQTGDNRRFEKFYKPEYAEALFTLVWQTIVDILPLLLELRLWEGWTLIEQHRDDPGPGWGQRFRYYHPAFTDLK
jgi:hypothetical protein